MRFVKAVLLTVFAVTFLSHAQTLHSGSLTAAEKPTLAAAAANTHYYGAVDLGSKGTKASLYSFVTEEDGRNPVVIFSKTVNTKLVSSMKDGQFTPDGVADAASAVKQVVDAMKAEAQKQSVDVDVYYVVGSSGVAKATNKQDLVDAVKTATGIDMDFVDAAHEGFYGLMSAVHGVNAHPAC